ncbi:hypothetical protein [Pinirhizobacter soli]|uniref:hypothetical protein n=1 Tax=Pinirhizobacter soli TaxID=2786953 RepID=UPI00202A7D9F|nr:hypothetical protein [Pinirhizobacter soli]
MSKMAVLLKRATRQLALLVISSVCLMAQAAPRTISIQAHVVDADSGKSFEGATVKVRHWHCIFFACGLDHVAQRVTDESGNAHFEVERKSKLQVSAVSCPDEPNMAGINITKQDLQQQSVTVELVARHEKCVTRLDPSGARNISVPDYKQDL